jgi:prepilin-type N-terminal cleavage/methylation domain-containing protein
MKKITCFSLVELLAVIVIGSILMSIAVPSFSRMIRGNASTQAGRELMGRIQAARAHTVANQTPVALVFYGRELPDGYSGNLPQDYIYSSYRFCEVKYDSGISRWVFQKWVGEWYFLPKGICIGLPRTITNALPAVFSDVDPANDETAAGLIPSCSGTGNDSEHPDYFSVNSDGSGVSPVYACDVSDIFPGNNNPVIFRNAIVFNSNGMMEKPKNSSNDDSVTVLTPDVPVVIPLRSAFISGTRVRFDDDTESEYIPVRIEPSGKTCFYDGYISF